MKRMFALFVALMVAVAFSGVAFAADQAAPAEKKMEAPKAEKKAEAPKAKKAKAQQFTGTVESVDAAAKTITVKGKKDTKTFTAGEKVDLGAVKVGEKVVVKHTGDTAKSVKAAAKKAHKKAEKKMEKKAEPAAPAAPAEKK